MVFSLQKEAKPILTVLSIDRQYLPGKVTSSPRIFGKRRDNSSVLVEEQKIIILLLFHKKIQPGSGFLSLWSTPSRVGVTKRRAYSNCVQSTCASVSLSVTSCENYPRRIDNEIVISEIDKISSSVLLIDIVKRKTFQGVLEK